MDSLSVTMLGFAVRFFVKSATRGNIRYSTSLVGLWEAAVLHHLDTQRQSIYRYVAYAFRISVDLFFTEGLIRTVLILLWTGLGVVLSDTVASIDHKSSRHARPRHSKRGTSRVPTSANKHPRRREPFPDTLLLHQSRDVRGTAPMVKPAVAPLHIPSFPARLRDCIEANSNQGLLKKPQHPSEGYKSDHVLPLPNTEHCDFPAPFGGILASSTRALSQNHLTDSLDMLLRKPPPELAVEVEAAISTALQDRNAKETPTFPDPLLSASVQSNFLPLEQSDGANDRTPTSCVIELPDLQTPITSASEELVSRNEPMVQDLRDASPLVQSLQPSPDDVILHETPTEAECPHSPVSESTDFTLPTPARHPFKGPLPSFLPSEVASIYGSEQTFDDRESVISAGSYHAIISRADDLRNEAIAGERERDRLKLAVEKSFLHGRIKEGIMLEGEVEEADDRSRKIHEKAAHRYFHGRCLPLSLSTYGLHLSFQLAI